MFPALPDLRASDADREQTVAFLNHHCAQGRLSPDELSARVGAAYRATGLAELGALTCDLPGSPFAPAAPSRSALARRRLGAGLGLAVMALATVAVAGALPPEVWASLLLLAVPLVAMLVVTVLPFAVPLLALAWVLGRHAPASLTGTARRSRRAGAARPW